MVDHRVMVGAEDARHIIVRLRVQGQAIGDDAATAQFFHGLFCVLAQVLGIADVDIRRFSVTYQQYQFLLLGLAQQEIRGMAQGAAHAGGQAAAHPGQARLDLIVVGLIEILEAIILYVVTAVG